MNLHKTGQVLSPLMGTYHSDLEVELLPHSKLHVYSILINEFYAMRVFFLNFTSQPLFLLPPLLPVPP